MTPQTLSAPGCEIVGGICIPPAQTTFSSAVAGPGILGGVREMTVSNTSPGSPFNLSGSVGGSRARLEGLSFGSMLLEWDANGAGLDLDLSDMLGITFAGGTSDSGYTTHVRLFSLHDSYFEFSRNLGSMTASPLPATYSFDLFTAVGHPNLRHINTIQIELVRSGGVAGWVSDLSVAPTSVPDGGSTIMFLSLGLVFVLWRASTST